MKADSMAKGEIEDELFELAQALGERDTIFAAAIAGLVATSAIPNVKLREKSLYKLAVFARALNDEAEKEIG